MMLKTWMGSVSVSRQWMRPYFVVRTFDVTESGGKKLNFGSNFGSKWLSKSGLILLKTPSGFIFGSSILSKSLKIMKSFQN